MNADEPRDVDALIDGIARAMTDDEPSHGLRAAVRRRIDAPAPKTAASRPWATAAIVAAATVWQLWQLNGQRKDSAAVRHEPDRAAAIAPVPVPEPAAEAPDGAASITASQHASADQAAPRGSRKVARQVARQSPGPAGEPSTVDIESLAIAPLNAAAIEVDAVVGPSVDIEPISIRPLAIGPSASDALE